MLDSEIKAAGDSFFARFMQDLGKTLGQTWKCRREPLADIHLHSDVSYDLPRGNRCYIFGFAAAAVIVAAFVTVALQSYRTAQANPALMMRSE